MGLAFISYIPYISLTTLSYFMDHIVNFIILESLDSKFDDEIKIDPEEHSDKDDEDDEDSKQESDDDEDDEEDDDEDDDDEDGTDDADILSSRLEDNENQDAGINRFSASNVEDEIEKGMAVQHQQSMHTLSYYFDIVLIPL